MKENPARLREPLPTRRKKPLGLIHRLEAQGLLIIAMLILLYTVLRYWHNIPWSAR